MNWYAIAVWLEDETKARRPGESEYIFQSTVIPRIGERISLVWDSRRNEELKGKVVDVIYHFNFTDLWQTEDEIDEDNFRELQEVSIVISTD